MYELSRKKDVVIAKEDGRIDNGAWSIPYTKNMDIMVVSVLEQGLIEETAQPLSKWAVDFGFSLMYKVVSIMSIKSSPKESYVNIIQ